LVLQVVRAWPRARGGGGLLFPPPPRAPPALTHRAVHAGQSGPGRGRGDASAARRAFRALYGRCMQRRAGAAVGSGGIHGARATRHCRGGPPPACELRVARARTWSRSPSLTCTDAHGWRRYLSIVYDHIVNPGHWTEVCLPCSPRPAAARTRAPARSAHARRPRRSAGLQNVRGKRRAAARAAAAPAPTRKCALALSFALRPSRHARGCVGACEAGWPGPYIFLPCMSA